MPKSPGMPPGHQRVNREQIIQKIKNFYRKHKRIPFKREFRHYSAAQRRFGTWNKAIEAAGFAPNPVMFSKKYIARDGHKCDSLAEKIIDDWLSAKKIKHKRNVPYPQDPSLTADFVTKNHWIEFFGLRGQVASYDRLLKRKLGLVKKHNIPLIAIYPEDLFPTQSNRLAKIIKIKK